MFQICCIVHLLTGSCEWSYDSTAFLFSLVNKPGWQPLLLNQFGEHGLERKYSIYSCSDLGPAFGGGHDFSISDHASTNTDSRANPGHTYSPPSGYSYGSSFAQSFLAGSQFFQPDEVEVFYKAA